VTTTTLERTIAAAILARCSDSQGGTSGSVEGQVRQGRNAADGLGWDVAAVHDVDDGFSASRFARKARKGWAALQEDIATGRVNAVIMRLPNRGSRTMSDWVQFLDLCRDRGALIHVTHGGRTYDTANYRDRKDLMDDGAQAEAFSDELSQTIREGVETARLEGRPLASVPFGYRKVHETAKIFHLEIDPEAATRVRRVFEMAAEGHSLADAGRATGLTRGHVGQIIKNRAYIAERVIDGQVIACQWEPILTPELFWAAQRPTTPQSATLRGRPKSTYKSLLGGIAVCGRCGGKVTTDTKHQKRRGTVRRYRCAAGCFKLDGMEAAEAEVRTDLVGHLIGPGVLERYDTDHGSEAAAAAAEAARLRAELDEWAAADISARAYALREAKLMPMIEAAERRSREMAAPPALRAFAGKFMQTDFPEYWQRISAAVEVLNAMPMEAQRALLREVATVTIYPQAMAAELDRPQVCLEFRSAA